MSRPIRPFWALLLFGPALLAATLLSLGLAAEPTVTTPGTTVPGALKPLPKFLRTPAVAQRYLSTRSVDEILQFERVEPVCLQLLERPGVPPEVREESLAKLAELRTVPRSEILLGLLTQLDEKASASADAEEADLQTVLQALGRLLPAQPASDLASRQEVIQKLAEKAGESATRQAALAAWIASSADVEAAWTFATAQPSPDALVDLLLGTRWLPADAPARGSLVARLVPKLDEALSADGSTDPVVAASIEAISSLPADRALVIDRLARFLAAGRYPDACIRSLATLSDADWSPEAAQAVAGYLLNHLKNLTIENRSSADAQLAVTLVQRLATRVPTEQASALHADLDRIAVRTITIHALEEKMAYDLTVLVVNAGQPIRLVFANDDIMPHNVVVVDSPAAREDVGIAADQMQNEPDALSRGYLPTLPSILHATKLLQPKHEGEISFFAPDKPGTYAYLCTFPGHWSRMYGALVVADNAQAYVASHTPLPSADELLGIRTVEWKEDELKSALAQLQGSRSFEKGQRIFQKASCSSCHQMRGEGGRIGPDLTKIREKYATPELVLQHILNPSEKVEDQYASVIVETADGQVLRGVVVQDSETELRINENPLASCEPKIIQKSDIEDITRSKISPMPEKLLNTIVEPSDIADLLTYLLSGGDPSDAKYTP